MYLIIKPVIIIEDSQDESADEPATIVIHIVVTGCSIYASRIPHKP